MEGLTLLAAFGSTVVSYDIWESYAGRPRKWYQRLGRACSMFTLGAAVLMVGFNFYRVPTNVRRTIAIFGSICATGVFAEMIDNSRY